MAQSKVFRVSDYTHKMDSEYIEAKNANEAIQRYFEINNIDTTPVRPKYQGDKDYNGRFHVINEETNKWSYFNLDGKLFNPSDETEIEVETVY